MPPSFDGPVPGIPGAIIREVEILPDHLPNSRKIGPHTHAAPGVLLFGVPGIGRFLVRNGTLIEVAVESDAARAATRVFLNDCARGTLIHQRGELALGAAAMVSPSGSAVAIAGSSGTGKSTLAAALGSRGWLLLSDAVTRVTWADRLAVAWPSDRRVRLWSDACVRLGFAPGALEQVRANLEQFYLPLEPSTAAAPLEVAVRVRVSPECNVIEVPAARRAEILSQCTYRPRQLIALGQQTAHARSVLQASRTCRVLVLDGARERPVDELAARLSEAVR